MVLLVSRAHRAPEVAQGVRRDRQRGLWESRAVVEGAVCAQLLRHLVNTCKISPVSGVIGVSRASPPSPRSGSVMASLAYQKTHAHEALEVSIEERDLG